VFPVVADAAAVAAVFAAEVSRPLLTLLFRRREQGIKKTVFGCPPVPFMTASTAAGCLTNFSKF